MIIPNHIIVSSETTGNAQSEDIVLTKDELNVLQYVGGFVPHSLLKKFERSKEHAKFLECLGDMAVVGEYDSDILDYT